MRFEHPAAVIDQTVANLEYLAAFFLDDIDLCPVGKEPTPRAKRAIAALEASRAMLPRLRVVRSNYVNDARLPDAETGAGLLTTNTVSG